MQRSTHVSGRHGRTDLIAATTTARRCIATALKARATPSELRTFLYSSVELVSWSRTADRMPLPQVAAATNLHPHTVGRNMRAWHERGVWEYSPARCEGEYGTVKLVEFADIEAGFTPTSARDAMNVVWPTMRRAALRTCQGPVAAVRVVLAVIAGSACWSRLEVSVSHRELAAAAGCTLAQVRRALAWLVDNDVIEYTPGTGHTASTVRLVAAVEVAAGPGFQLDLALGSPAEQAGPDAPGVASTGPVVADLAASACVEEEHPGCASGDRPVHHRDNVETTTPETPSSARDIAEGVHVAHRSEHDTAGAEGETRTASGGRAEEVAAALAGRTGRTVLLDSPAAARFAAAVTLRAGWCVEDIVEAVLDVPLPHRVLNTTALLAFRLEQLPVESPDVSRAQQRATDAAARQRIAERERERQLLDEAADAAANQVLEPYLALVDALAADDLAVLAARLPAFLRSRFKPGPLTALMRSAFAERLAADDGVDLELAAEEARQAVLTHRSGTMVGR